MLFIRDDEIIDNSLQDMCYFVGCGSCKYHDPRGDQEGFESPCKRIDHKHIQLAKPWFKSYDCGQQSATMCNDFEPKDWCVYLKEHWTNPLDYAAMGDESRIHGGISLCLDKDQSVRYVVEYRDFWFNTFRNSDGSLRWYQKSYYKQTRKSPTGYVLVRELPNGEVLPPQIWTDWRGWRLPDDWVEAHKERIYYESDR